MDEVKKHIDDLIIAYLSKELDSDSFDELEIWIAALPENKKYFEEQKEIWFCAIPEKETAFFNKDKAFEKFKTRVNEQQNQVLKSQKKLQISTFLRYAAVFSCVLGLAYFSYWWGGTGSKVGVSKVVMEAPLGSKSKIYLPDGTLVWLNSGSIITYSQGANIKGRVVDLVGEGYFEVKRDEKNPIFVRTKSLEVKVLGTKFNFRDYPDDKEAIVSLSKGKVALVNLVKQENGEILLNPNERAVLNKENGQVTLEQVTASNASEWTKGFLFFDEVLLSDLVKELERSYNVKIHIANDVLKKVRIYGNFVRREQSVQEILEALAATQKLHYSIKDNVVTLY